MINEKVMRLALDALEYNQADWKGKNKALEALYAALVQPQREWQGLTDDEIQKGNRENWVTEQAWQSAVWWAEAKLKEKNT
jgi:hypothetical protein